MRIAPEVGAAQIHADRVIREEHDRFWANYARRQTEASAALEGRSVPEGFKRSNAVQQFLDGRTSMDAGRES